ncbi:MAG TPA: hypothetical protein PKC89_12635 [Pyrinomonadaceae bacterium]|nr:hypothetical protein [Pyrinomonadaceae bacterium]
MFELLELAGVAVADAFGLGVAKGVGSVSALTDREPLFLADIDQQPTAVAARLSAMIFLMSI